MSLDSASKGAKQSQLFSDCQEQLSSISQTYRSILKYREENMEGITDDKQRIKENLKKIKEKLMQRFNQMENELTNKLDILVQENTKFQQDEISKVLEATEKVKLYLREMLFIVEHGSKNKPSFYVEK
jgi:cysteinyl-tRNA synthetase